MDKPKIFHIYSNKNVVFVSKRENKTFIVIIIIIISNTCKRFW